MLTVVILIEVMLCVIKLIVIIRNVEAPKIVTTQYNWKNILPSSIDVIGNSLLKSNFICIYWYNLIYIYWYNLKV